MKHPKKTESEVVKYKDWESVNERLDNVNITFKDDHYPTADRSIYPVTLKHNWDFRTLISEPLLSDAECDWIISQFEEDKEEPDKTIAQTDYDYRKCTLNWIAYYQPKWEWLFDKILPFVEEINKEIFKFDLTSPITCESLQLTKYKSGDYYDLHTDWTGGTILDTRKLSFSIDLSDPSDYRGGGLEVYGLNSNKQKGFIHIFPSFLQHKAIKVRRGTRFSLVGWIAGPPFK
tara:strand:- start:232 stop:927 length:696 start_codon:yes stop_codon:yes gene_type:complete